MWLNKPNMEKDEDIVMIKNVIFDVGNVLLSYRWKYAFMQSGIDEATADIVFNKTFEDSLWEDLDRGVNDHYETKRLLMEKHPEYAYTIGYFLDHPEHMPLPREEVWKEVHRLKESGYNLFILSNYSHVLFNEHTKGCPFLEDIPEENRVISYRINMIKPEAEIYEYLLNKYDLKADECLFFDDRKDNTEGAISVGMKAICVPTEEMLLDELRKL